MSKLHIDKLGALQNIDFEVKQFNLFIGEQGVGKSTICKAIYFFRLLKENIVDYLFAIAKNGIEEDEVFPQILNKKNKDLFVSLFGYSWDMPNDIKFSYFYANDISVKVSIGQEHSDKHYLDIKFSDKLLKNLRKLREKIAKSMRKAKKQDLLFDMFLDNNLRQSISREIFNIFLDDDLPTYYIPAGRSLLTLLTNQKTNINYESLDFINRNFMRMIEFWSRFFDSGISETIKYFPNGNRKFDARALVNEIINKIKGEYVADSKIGEILKINDNTKLSINYISSGQQESLWIFNLLYIWLLQDKKAFVIIEEPEAHVYPTMQKFILDFIVQFMNLTGSNIIITTHSPYMLTNSNLLYYAGDLKNKEKNIDKITGKYKFINPEQSNIYKIKLDENTKDTKFEDLKIKDESDLKTELIDEVSDIINEQYTKLIDLENK